MGPEFCLSEEHGSQQQDSDCDLLKIEDLENKDIEPFIPLFNSYMAEVNQEDPLALIDVQGVQIPAGEARLLWHMYQSHRVIIVRNGAEQIVGFIVCEIPYGGIMVVRVLYFEKSYRGRGLMRKFVDSVGKDTKKIFFQTRVDNPPKELLTVTYGRRSKIWEDAKFITWEMELQHA